MAVTPYWYGNGLLNVLKGSIDMDTDTLKLSLHTSSYSPNQDTHDYFNDCTNELSTANGYTAGGATLSGKALTYDSSSNEIRFDCDDPGWTFTAAVTWRYGVIRKARGGASSADEVLAYLDWGASQTISTGYTLQIAPTGLLYVTVA